MLSYLFSDYSPLFKIYSSDVWFERLMSWCYPNGKQAVETTLILTFLTPTYLKILKYTRQQHNYLKESTIYVNWSIYIKK